MTTGSFSASPRSRIDEPIAKAVASSKAEKASRFSCSAIFAISSATLIAFLLTGAMGFTASRRQVKLVSWFKTYETV